VNSIILGFDVRVAQCDPLHAKRWTKSRREKYLLRTDVPFPLSVDREVWPSLFSFENGPRNQHLAPIHVVPLDFHQQGLRLWANLSDMQNSIVAGGRATNDGLAVCIALEAKGPQLTEDRWQMAFEERTCPPNLDPRWRFMGCDVADRYFTSGLSNCACGPEKMERLRVTCGSDINVNGLFTTVHAAARFKKYADELFPAHAPFFVFGLHQV